MVVLSLIYLKDLGKIKWAHFLKVLKKMIQDQLITYWYITLTSVNECASAQLVILSLKWRKEAFFGGATSSCEASSLPEINQHAANLLFSQCSNDGSLLRLPPWHSNYGARTRHYYQSLDAETVTSTTKGSKSEGLEEEDRETTAESGRELGKCKKQR